MPASGFGTWKVPPNTRRVKKDKGWDTVERLDKKVQAKKSGMDGKTSNAGKRLNRWREI